MSDTEPLFDLRRFSASKLSKLREETFSKYSKLKFAYLSHYELSIGTQIFLNAKQNYHLLEGQKANLYKFLLFKAGISQIRIQFKDYFIKKVYMTI